ncbi:YtxH domain-containing protein [candidate division FCPU426 bacterium]|nr:YtxH domain-containing protein [candidate division FCPU426 bacterium]
MAGIMKIIIGIVLGAAAGYAVHRLVGCPTGACPIWNSPFYAALYGGVLGGFLGSSA